ncbi:MAG: rhodanese-like domain-containing protein [Candidatus Omnitrophota bacterium]|nr:rhodanese-like domain-containing protein [Candidatus Omnitrophota bacterium]
MNPADIDIDIHSISPEDFKKYALVDVREDEEIREWPAQAEHLCMPCSGFPLNKDVLSKDTSYLIFCAKGGRSHHVAELLQAEGYNAVSVNNGIASVNAYLEGLPK